MKFGGFMIMGFFVTALLLFFSPAIISFGFPQEEGYRAFREPKLVTIRGYDGHAMEPFISRDGKYLLFNNSNDPKVDTNLHYATRVDDLTFEYMGEIKGVNTDRLDAVPTMDGDGNLYFVSIRNYEKTKSTIFRGKFQDGSLTGITLVRGVSKKKRPHLNFDVDISRDGNTMYFVDGVFSGLEVPKSADLAIAVKKGNRFKRHKKSKKFLANINTSELEYAACISNDGLELFFTRLYVDRKKLGVYRSARKSIDEPFGKPQRVIALKGFVEAPALSPDERSLYFHRKQNNKFVIYRVTR